MKVLFWSIVLEGTANHEHEGLAEFKVAGVCDQGSVILVGQDAEKKTFTSWDLCPKDSTTSQDHATERGPSVQTHEPVEDIPPFTAYFYVNSTRAEVI